MKKLINYGIYRFFCFLPFFTGFFAHSKELLNFQDIESALNAGKNVRLVVNNNYDVCGSNYLNHLPETLITNLTSVEITLGVIEFSDSNLITSSAHKGTLIIRLREYHLYSANNTFVLSIRDFDPMTHQPLDSHYYSCVHSLGKTAKFFEF